MYTALKFSSIRDSSNCNTIILSGRRYFGVFYLPKAKKYNILAASLHKVRAIQISRGLDVVGININCSTITIPQ